MNATHAIRRLLLVLPAISWSVAGSAGARADAIELTNGGHIQGELIETAEDSSETYTIATPGGGQITIDRSEVANVVSDRNNNSDAGEAEQIPDDKASKSRAQSRDEIMAARGMVWYDGKYHTRQHIELLEQLKQVRASEADWNNRLKRWRRWLTGRRQDRIDEAVREIRAIRDPLAAPAIVEWLRQEENPAIKRMLVDLAARIDDPLTFNALVGLSLYEPHDELRFHSLEYVVQSGRPGIANPYIQALRSSDNQTVNRAAKALEEIGSRDAVGPLVNALVTKHKFQVSSGSSDQHAYQFTPSGGMAMNFGSSPPKIVTQEVENRSVLTALAKLSGASFGYDQDQWRDWLATQAKANAIDVRRDF
jgi:hypothetical protein